MACCKELANIFVDGYVISCRVVSEEREGRRSQSRRNKLVHVESSFVMQLKAPASRSVAYRVSLCALACILPFMAAMYGYALSWCTR